jgi:ankyrin repeat protein
MTPLMAACNTGNTAIVELLLKNGADVSATNVDGKSVIRFI